MEQLVLIPQQLYAQKFKLNVYKLDKSEEKVNFVPQNLDSFHKDITTNTKSFKNESVVDQILKCSRIKLSLSDSILLDGRDTDVAFTDFIYALKRKNIEVPDTYYTILDATGIDPNKIVNKDAKAKTEGVGSLSKSEKAKPQRLYKEWKAAFGSVRNLQKASGLSRGKVISFLHAKNSYTKYRQATRHFRRLPAFGKRINEIWCLDLAFMYKLSECNNGVKYLLFCIDVFYRFVRVQLMKSKNSTDAVAAFTKMLRKNNIHKVWVDQGTEFGGEFRKFCGQKKIKIYSTRSETKAAVAERSIRSLKNIIYRFMEENGYKCLVKMSSFLKAMSIRVNRITSKAPKEVKNKDFLSIFY